MLSAVSVCYNVDGGSVPACGAVPSTEKRRSAAVLTREQNKDRQVIVLREVGVPEKIIYMDKQSGKDFDRPQYKKMLRKLKKDDLLYVKSIDRLGHN